jgi:hypothetical protein
MDTSAGTPEAYARANELYWGSNRSVNQIADELDLSKGALYEMIRPRPAGLGCPDCGAEVVHPNRTAKERERVGCASCDWEGLEHEAIRFGPRLTRDAPPADSADDVYTESDFDAPVLPPPFYDAPTPGRRLVVGGALLGAAVGLALVIWARRR